MFNEGTDQDSEVLADMREDNRTAPYPFEGAQIVGAPLGTVFTNTQYPGGAKQAPTLQYHDGALVTASTIGGTTRLKGGNFPCGLMRFLWSPTDLTSGIRMEQ